MFCNSGICTCLSNFVQYDKYCYESKTNQLASTPVVRSILISIQKLTRHWLDAFIMSNAQPCGPDPHVIRMVEALRVFANALLGHQEQLKLLTGGFASSKHVRDNKTLKIEETFLGLF